ncbi:unnamed protein product [Prunus brigantina]
MENLGCTKASEGIFDRVPTTGYLEDATGRQAISAKPTGYGVQTTEILVWIKAVSKSLVWEVCCIYEKKYLASEFEMKSLGDLKYFLGIEVARSKHVSVVSHFMHSPSEVHIGAVMRILRYLKVTPGKGLMFSKYGHTYVEGYTDVDWAGSATDRHSTSGYFTFDAIAISHNHVQHDRTKHVEVDQNFIKEKLDAEIASFPFISSEY